MKKYIVKNCPALNLPLFEDYEEPAIKNGCMQEETGCEEINNCMIKQIVELCKSTCRKRCTNDCLGTRKHCGYGQILNLLEIEEVNE